MGLTPLTPTPDDLKRTMGTQAPMPSLRPVVEGPEPTSLGPLPALSGNPPPPQMPGLKSIVTNPQDQMRQELQQKIQQYYTPPNPTGFWGKLGHALAQTGAWQQSGTMEARRNQETQREKELGTIQEQTLAQQKQQSEAGLQSAQADYYRQHGQSLASHQITPEEAAAMGNPNLAGSMMDPKVWETLVKQHGEDVTKKEIATQGNQTKLQTAQLAAMNKIQPHIVVEVGGQPHVMERDPATGAYSVDRGIAPPNYAAVLPEVLSTKTTELLGPDDVMHRYQYNAQTKTYSDDLGAAPTGQAAHQIFQGGAIEQFGPQVIADINANREILGNLSSYYKQWLSGTPVADPRAAGLLTELMSFAATQPALHAFRSTNAMEAFERIIGGLAKDPDATIASINAMMKLPEVFTNLPKGPTNRPAGPAQNAKAPAVGTVEDGYRFKGGDPAKQENWEKVAK